MYKAHARKNSYCQPTDRIKSAIKNSLNIKKPITNINSVAHTRANTGLMSSDTSAAHKRQKPISSVNESSSIST